MALAVHDFFEILGVSDDAPASEIRRACARRERRSHPDFRHGKNPVRPLPPAPRADAAVDFVDVAAIIERMQGAFFGRAR